MNLQLLVRLATLQFKIGARNFLGRLTQDRGGWRSVLLLVLLGFAMLPLLTTVLGAAVGAYLGLRAVGQPAASLTAFIVLGQMIALVFGFFFIMSAFYFSRDLKILLPLPLQPATVVGAKFLQVLVSEYLTMAVVVLPTLVVYGIGSGTALFWPVALLVFLLLPVLPLAVDGLLVLLLMAATAGRRLQPSRDMLRVLGAMLGIAVALSFQFGVRSQVRRALPNQAVGVRIGRQPSSGGPFAQVILQNKDMIQTVGRYVPPAVWATRAMAEPASGRGLAGLGGYMGISLGAAALLLAVVNRLYLRSLLVDEGGRRRPAATGVQVQAGAARLRSPFVALLWREYALLLRTPMFLMNATLPVLLLPIVSLAPLAAAGDAGAFARLLASQSWLQAVLPAVGMAAVLLVVLSGSVSNTAISREGRRFWISRTLPVDPGLQVAAKVAFGLLHSLIGVLFITGVMVWLHVPLAAVLLTIITSLFASACAQAAMVSVDLVRPYLTWTDPQQAIKGNLNGFLGVLVMLILIVILGVCTLLLYLLSPVTVVPGLVLITGAGAYGLYRWDVRLARTRYREIED